jgi:hypothetical protein
MIDELMTFTGEKMPDKKYIFKPKPIKKTEKKKKPRASYILGKKQSITNVDGYDELLKLEEATLNLKKEQEAFSLAEKVLKRQQDEQEARRREILKQLNKKKHIDLDKFLTRVVGFEQKKNFDLEQKRFKKLEEESKLCKERPLLSHKTIEMCKSLNKKPIYERTNEIIEKKQKNINEIKNREYSNNNKLRSKKISNDKQRNVKANNSMDNINENENKKKRKKKEYIINDVTKNKKMNTREMEDYYNRQREWKKRTDEKNKIKENNIKGIKESIKEEYFHPHISQGSIEIINAKNEANEYNKQFQGTKQGNLFYIDNDNYTNSLNFGKSVYDRLYEDNALNEIRKNDYINKSICSFQPFTNKNKYKQIQSKYNDINNTKRPDKKNLRNYKNKPRLNKSVEVVKNNDADINDKIHKINKKQINEPWTNTLLKINNKKNSNDDDNCYRLNIRQASAWNENDVNTVPYRGGSLEIVKFFI